MSAYPGQKDIQPPFIVHAYVTSYDNPDPDSFRTAEPVQDVNLAGYGIPTFPQLSPMSKPLGALERRPQQPPTFGSGFRYRGRFDGV